MNSLARTIMTLNCRDCDIVPKVAGAGRILEHEGEQVQLMHNGLKVLAGGYHGDWMAQVIRGLQGHHEPQEELIFHALLRYCRHNSLIVELGCFWSYYSLWYLLEVPGSNALCIEPDPHNIEVGRRNAALNGMSDRATFEEAWIGSSAEGAVTMVAESTGDARTLPCLDLTAVVARTGGRTIELLHCDAQGAETPFLASARPELLANDRVRFLVVSTHHRSISGDIDTHGQCCDLIRSLGGQILVEHDVQESFSGDGLIVASFFDQDRDLPLPPISRNEARNSLFPER